MAEGGKIGLNSGVRAGTKTPQPLVAQPVRDFELPADPVRFKNFLNSISVSFPYLKKALIQADMHYTPAGFIQVALTTAFYISAVLMVITFLVVRHEAYALPLLIVMLPVFYLFGFVYTLYLPQVKARMRAKNMEQELVFAGRHLMIELKAGIPLFDSMLGISRDYGEVSTEFNKVVEKVTLGVPLGVALHEVAENNPSHYFRRVVLQMANSLSSGSDVATALESALDQISKEQVIELKAYGQKLNPLVMFFMIFGIIMPSLGVAFLIILSSFLGGTGLAFSATALFGILVMVCMVQFIFLTVVQNSRPKFDIA